MATSSNYNWNELMTPELKKMWMEGVIGSKETMDKIFIKSPVIRWGTPAESAELTLDEIVDREVKWLKDNV